MFPTSKRWMVVAAIGQGVLCSLALTGFVRLFCLAVGEELPERLAGNVALASNMLAGATAVYFYSRYSKRAEANVPAAAPRGR